MRSSFVSNFFLHINHKLMKLSKLTLLFIFLKFSIFRSYSFINWIKWLIFFLNLKKHQLQLTMKIQLQHFWQERKKNLTKYKAMILETLVNLLFNKKKIFIYVSLIILFKLQQTKLHQTYSVTISVNRHKYK